VTGGTGGGVHLRRTDENVREIEALAAVLGGRVGIDGVLDDLNRQARRTFLLGRWRLGQAVDWGFAWDDEDRADERWWPQGVSTSADASDTEDIGGRHVLAVSWYAKDESGVRITFVDLAGLRYRHVLLVVPVLDQHGALTLRPLRVHAGGIVWNGPYLHVAATARGLVTCRVDDLMYVPDLRGSRAWDRLGLDGEQVASYGYRYVLPVRFSYRAYADADDPPLRYSFLSLDRGGERPVLVAGEYGQTGQTTRLARYHLEPDTLMLQTGEDGYARPIGIDERGVVRMQGASIVDGRYHVTVSHGPWKPGSVYVGQPGDPDSPWVEHRLATPMGPEDIAYWPSTDRFWSVSEHPHRRWVFSMKRSRFD
jgi:hypothetical protein